MKTKSVAASLAEIEKKYQEKLAKIKQELENEKMDALDPVREKLNKGTEALLKTLIDEVPAAALDGFLYGGGISSHVKANGKVYVATIFARGRGKKIKDGEGDEPAKPARRLSDEEILNYLEQYKADADKEKRTTGALEQAFDVSGVTLGKKLKPLLAAGKIAKVKQGLNVFWSKV